MSTAGNCNLVKIAAAASELDVSVRTVRRYLEDGAPVALRGRGRGRNTLVDVQAIEAWRRNKNGTAAPSDALRVFAAELPEIAASAIAEAFRQIDGNKCASAGVLAAAWFLVTSALLDRVRRDCPDLPELDAVPEKVDTLRRIFEASATVRRK